MLQQISIGKRLFLGFGILLGAVIVKWSKVRASIKEPALT